VTDGLSIYRSITRDLQKATSRSAADPVVKRETRYYLATIGSIKSAKDFVANDRVLQYATTAFGLADLTGSKAFIKKLLEEGVDDPHALANRLADSRYRTFVANFNFQRYGSATTAFDRTQQGTVDLYTRQSLESQLGQSSDTARLALYFQRKAPALGSTLAILADKAVFEVVRTALGLPLAFSNNSIDKQVAILDGKLKIADFKDPVKLDQFITRYFALASAGQLQTTPALSVFQSAGTRNVSIGTDLLAQIQSFKLGGR
jgi:Protein of unknown function (DUF1217)